METKKHIHALHVAILAGAVASFGVSFDGWWHLAKGRDSFFILPHLLVQGSLFVMLAQSFFAWRRRGMPSWRRIFFALLVVPMTIPFDEAWHRWRGKETVESVLIIWSPPHFFFFGAAITALTLLVHEIKKERDLAGREIFGALLLASLLNILLIFFAPFFPFSPYAIAGFGGACIAAFLSIAVYFFAERFFGPVIPALLAALFTLTFQGALFDAGVVAGSRAAGSYPHLPNWLLALSTISMVGIVSSGIVKKSTARGFLAGAVGGLFLYALPLQFAVFPVSYDAFDAVLAITGTTAGGALAAILVNRMVNEQPIVNNYIKL
ncbi:MAG: hypothetical protein Q8Q94_02840 [bacterium]|nr:hypothetical protein [bacterium]MDZ4299914.1 hypothetical protein [Candidatus Sungbacteria bacterium]